MTMSDPIADMLTRIRNASLARHSSCEMPFSKIKVSIAEVLRDEGYIESFGGPRGGHPQGAARLPALRARRAGSRSHPDGHQARQQARPAGVRAAHRDPAG